MRARALAAFAVALTAGLAHVEAVAGIVGRAEVLARAGGLGALVLHARARGGRGALGEGVAFFLALASKESAVAVVPIAVLLDLARERRVEPRRFVALALAL